MIRANCIGCGGVIEEKLGELKLTVNPKSAIYNCSSRGGVAFLGYRYCLERGGKCGGMILRVECVAKTVRRVRKRLKNLHMHDLEKYYRSYEAYKGYFAGALPKRKI